MATDSSATFWTDPQAATSPSDVELTMAARSMIAARRALAGPLPIDLIHDTALDVLLALFVAQFDRRPVTEAELASGASVGRSVLLRWLRALTNEGLVEIADTEAGPGAIVRLTEHGVATVGTTIAAVIRSQFDLHAN